jgi:ubiquinone/menaquinone biosynthesis C-methylase UbiE
MTGPVQVHPQNGVAFTDVCEAQLRPLYIASLGALDPRPGTRLLHVGCGTGTALELAARSGAEVAGLDASVDLLKVARDRLPDADLRVADAADLPYDRGCFDQVMAFDAIQYIEPPAVAVAELARVTRPGGSVAIGLWHNWSGREASAFLNAVRGLVPAPAPDAQPVRDLYRLREVMKEAGLDVYVYAEVTHRYDFASLDAAWDSMQRSPNVARAIEVVGLDAAHEVFLANFGNQSRPDGSIEQDNLFQYAVGRATS